MMQECCPLFLWLTWDANVNADSAPPLQPVLHAAKAEGRTHKQSRSLRAYLEGRFVPTLASLHATPAGTRPIDDGGLRGCRERSRNPTLIRRYRRVSIAQQRRIAPKGATSTKPMGEAGTVTKAAACKTRC